MYMMVPVDYTKLTAADRRLSAGLTAAMMLLLTIGCACFTEWFGTALAGFMLAIALVVTLIEHRTVLKEANQTPAEPPQATA